MINLIEDNVNPGQKIHIFQDINFFHATWHYTTLTDLAMSQKGQIIWYFKKTYWIWQSLGHYIISFSLLLHVDWATLLVLQTFKKKKNYIQLKKNTLCCCSFSRIIFYSLWYQDNCTTLTFLTWCPPENVKMNFI